MPSGKVSHTRYRFHLLRSPARRTTAVRMLRLPAHAKSCLGISCFGGPKQHYDIRVDSCLAGAGDTIQKTGDENISEYYGTPHPTTVTQREWPITQLEALNVLAALKTLLAIARQVWMLQAKLEFSLSVVHCPGRLMVAPDMLSRRHLQPSNSHNLPQLAKVREVQMSASFFSL